MSESFTPPNYQRPSPRSGSQWARYMARRRARARTIQRRVAEIKRITGLSPRSAEQFRREEEEDESRVREEERVRRVEEEERLEEEEENYRRNSPMPVYTGRAAGNKLHRKQTKKARRYKVKSKRNNKKRRKSNKKRKYNVRQ